VGVGVVCGCCSGWMCGQRCMCMRLSMHSAAVWCQVVSLACQTMYHAGQRLLVASGLLTSYAFLCLRCVMVLHCYLCTACRELRHSTCALGMS
jgi:hypothetical protein